MEPHLTASFLSANVHTFSCKQTLVNTVTSHYYGHFFGPFGEGNNGVSLTKALQSTADDKYVTLSSQKNNVDFRLNHFCSWLNSVEQDQVRRGVIVLGLSLTLQADVFMWLVAGELYSQEVILVVFSFCFLKELLELTLIVARENPQPRPVLIVTALHCGTKSIGWASCG